MSAHAEVLFLRIEFTCLAEPAASKLGRISTVVRWELVYHVECVMLLFGFCHSLHLGAMSLEHSIKDVFEREWGVLLRV